jgi:hypothetical protein
MAHLCKCGCGHPTDILYWKGLNKGYQRYRPGHRPREIVDGQRQCKDCETWKPVTDFWFARRPNGNQTLSSYCKPCHRKRSYATRVKKWGSTRNYGLLKRYGITEQQVLAMIEKQGGLCPLCLKRPACAVDHCHETNQVRGILCDGCNSAIGRLGDTEAKLQRVVKYLQGKL